MVIIEFPDRSKAEAFLSDPSIQDLFKVRHQTTTSKLVLVDGCRWMPKPYRRAAVVSDYPELAASQHASSNVHRSGCATANGNLVQAGRFGSNARHTLIDGVAMVHLQYGVRGGPVPRERRS